MAGEIIFPNDLFLRSLVICYHGLCDRCAYVLPNLERKRTNNSAVRHLGYHYHNGTYGSISGFTFSHTLGRRVHRSLPRAKKRGSIVSTAHVADVVEVLFTEFLPFSRLKEADAPNPQILPSN